MTDYTIEQDEYHESYNEWLDQQEQDADQVLIALWRQEEEEKAEKAGFKRTRRNDPNRIRQ